MGLRGASPPLSQLTGFLNKIAIPRTSNWSLDPLACRAESSTALTTVSLGPLHLLPTEVGKIHQ